MIRIIALRELRSLFLSPLAWVVLAVTQLILAWLFLSQIDAFFKIQPQLTTHPNPPGVTDLVIAPLLEVSSIILLMVSPLLTMRLISEEHRNKTFTLLLSAPVSITQITLGKFMGILLFYMLFIAMIALMPLSLYAGTDIDPGKLAAGLIGLTLLLASFAAAGIYLSSLTTNPVVAAVSTFGLLLLLWIFDKSGGSTETTSIFSYLSLTSHVMPMLRGILNTADIAYFIIFITTFLLLTIKQLDALRLQQ